MDVIYEPTGAAKEYAPLAINLYHGCRFACSYCYAPDIARKKLHEWSKDPQPKKNILKRVEADAQKIVGDPRSILLCFTCDPYQSEEAAKLTREVLLILERYKLTATVLTKAGEVAIQDFDILLRNKWEFGTSICCKTDMTRWLWEQNAASTGSRARAIIKAHEMGIETWASMEPVYDVKEALATIQALNEYVDVWKIGKMNHWHQDLFINWPKFREKAIELCERLGAEYYIKKELRDAK